MTKWMTAQDTFVAQLKDGSSLRVQRGSTWPARHEVVLKDGGRGHLFKELDTGEDEQPAPAPAKSAPAKAEAPKAEAKAAPVKATAPHKGA
jgi:hypothetical protein